MPEEVIIVERDEALKRASRNLWKGRYDRGEGFRPETLANDIWDLFANGAQRVKDFATTLPFFAMVLVVGGWPCPQLSNMSEGDGAAGLCGKDSSCFYALYLFIFIFRKQRPDADIQFILENVLMQPQFKLAIKEAMGIENREDSNVEVNTGEASLFTRKRGLFSSFRKGVIIIVKRR